MLVLDALFDHFQQKSSNVEIIAGNWNVQRRCGSALGRSPSEIRRSV
jgi:hypothetical protein